MKRFSVIVALAVVTAAVSGCGQSKVAQCNALVDAANKGQDAVAKIDFEKEATVKAAVDGLEASNKAVSEVKLSDEKLIELQKAYVKAHTDAAAKFKEFGEIGKKGAALEKDKEPDPAKLAAFAKDLEKMNKDSDAMAKASEKVVDDLNVYCSGSK
jgi:hypothetical protein